MSAPRGSQPDLTLAKSLAKSVLNLEEIDTNLFRGKHLWHPPNARGVYGGQVVGQALVAAGHTVPEHLHVHSLHTYFVAAGDYGFPILYQVERVRDGNSFSNRIVKAIQRGKIISTIQVSYHKQEAGVLEFQYGMPDVPRPHELRTQEELIYEILEGYPGASRRRKGYLQKVLASELPVEIKEIDEEAYLKNKSHREKKPMKWIKARGYLGQIKNEDDINLHRCVVAYMSDFFLMEAVLRHSGAEKESKLVRMMASLDHIMWFHAPFRADEWLLFEMESPQSGQSRALALGRMWTEDGRLAVSVAQEGVVRGKL